MVWRGAQGVGWGGGLPSRPRTLHLPHLLLCSGISLHLFIAGLFAQGRTRILHSLADTTDGSTPAYQMGLLPWHDPLDTVVAFSARLGYYKPYLLWQDGAFQYDDLSVLPFQQAAYLTTEVPLIWSRKPYSRVRFDQSSRKTQLLSVRHGQTFRRGTGISFLYQRRTRTGEYVGQTTDHYGTGITFYTMPGRGWIRFTAGWNQLQDAINGGIIYNDSPEQGFLKERQPVRMNGARLRRWYRFAEGEAGIHLAERIALAFQARLTEDRLEKQAPAALRAESPLSADTLPMVLGVRQMRRQGSVGFWLGRWQTRIQYSECRGTADTALIAGWRFSTIEGITALQLQNLLAELRYRHWFGAGSPSPAFQGELRWHPRRYEVGVAHFSRNLPWLAYQAPALSPRPVNEQLTRAWLGVRFPAVDTTLPPLTVQIWGSRWEHPWLAEQSFLQRAVIVSAGVRVQGGWREGAFGSFTGINVQRMLIGPMPWQNVLPVVSGWVQPFIRWQLPGRPPVYQLGVRLSGFTAFRPLAYDMALSTFYSSQETPSFMQSAYVWADPYFVVLIRRVMVYLRVEHVSEGWLAPGYYLTAWYPMPGRAFSFGVQWDIYN